MPQLIQDKQARALAAGSLQRVLLWAVTAMLPLLPASTENARAQSAPKTPALNGSSVPSDTMSALLGSTGPVPQSTANSQGASCLEMLRGNGGRNGYTLSHGAILPATVNLFVDGGHLQSGQDYWLDASSGSLFFANSVPFGDAISVSYRYLEGKEAQNYAPSGFLLSLAPNTSMGLMLGMTAGDGMGYQTGLNGFAIDSLFGASKLSHYNGLLYFSDVKQSNNQILNFQTSAPSTATPPPATGKDHLIVQGLTLQSGYFRFNANIQDVGQKFGGFSALRAADRNDKALLDQMTQLEKEKGIQRLGFDLGWTNAPASGASKSAAIIGGLDLQQQRFADKSGSLLRDVLSFKAGGLDFSLFRRQTNSGFNRLGDLTAAEKSTLALDIYHSYDPRAEAKLMTAADLTQVVQETGLDRSGTHFALALGKRGGVDFSQMQISSISTPAAATSSGSAVAGASATSPATPSPGMSREAFSLNTGAFNLNFLMRRTDAGFSRLTSLSDIDKRYLALDILRQFDPNTQLSQVTAAQKDQAATDEVGLARSALRGSLGLGKSGKGATLSFVDSTLTDLTTTAASGSSAPSSQPEIQRQMLTYTSSQLQCSLTRQFIADGFSRLASLTDMEKPQYGNEHGFQRSQWNIVWQVNKKTRLSASSLQIGGTADAVANARKLALQNGTDPAAATQAALAGLRHEAYKLELTGLTLTANVNDTDKSFARSSDLALTDADRQQVSADPGFHRMDGSLHFDRIKGFTLDSYVSRGKDSVDNLLHNIYRDSFAYTPNKRFGFNFSADSDLNGAVGQENGARHSQLALNSSLDKVTTLKLTGSTASTFTNGADSQGVQQESLELDSSHLGAGGSLQYSVQRLRSPGDVYQDQTSFNVHAKPTPRLTLGYTSSDLERNPDPQNAEEAGKKQIDEYTAGYDLQYQATKQFAVTFGSTTTTTNDNKDNDVVSVGLQGQPFKNITLAAKFNEVHDVGAKNTKDVADFAISNSKPITFGPVHDLTVKAGYSSLNDQRKLQNETMTGHAQWTLWKNSFLLDYNGQTQPDGTSFTSRLYSFTTDANPKLPFHGSFFYKVRTLIDGKDYLVRRFTADARLSKTTSFVYTYGTLPEDAQGQIQPQTTADIALKHQFLPNLSGRIFYRLSDDTGTKILTRGLGFGLEGQLNPTTKLALTLSKDTNGTASLYDRSDHLRLSFSHKINATDYISIGTELRTHDGRDAIGYMLKNQLRTDLDVNIRF